MVVLLFVIEFIFQGQYVVCILGQGVEYVELVFILDVVLVWCIVGGQVIEGDVVIVFVVVVVEFGVEVQSIGQFQVDMGGDLVYVMVVVIVVVLQV